jgi:hypothetical protein
MKRKESFKKTKLFHGEIKTRKTIKRLQKKQEYFIKQTFTKVETNQNETKTNLTNKRKKS